MDKNTQYFKENKNDTRNAILGASQEIFKKYGYRKTSISDIAKKLRKTKSAVYYYFKNKEEIFKAVLDKEATELKQEALKAIDSTDNAEEKIRLYFRVRISVIKKLGNLYDFKNKSILSSENVASLRNKFDKLEVDIIHGILDYGIEDGKFQIKNPYLTSVLLLTMIKGLEIPILAESPEYIHERIDELLPILFHGISLKE